MPWDIPFTSGGPHLLPLSPNCTVDRTKENGRMWRERIQAVIEYFDSHFHQIVQSKDEGKCWNVERKDSGRRRLFWLPSSPKLYSRQTKEMVECGEKRFRPSLNLFWLQPSPNCTLERWRKTLECGGKEFRLLLNILTPAFTKLYSRQNEGKW